MKFSNKVGENFRKTNERMERQTLKADGERRYKETRESY